ncbi:unnamed protein product [Diamesa serratosioi]
MKALITFISSVLLTTFVKSDCIVNNNYAIHPTPLFIEATHKKTFYQPLIQAGKLVFKNGDTLVIACTGAGNEIDRLKIQEAEVKCEPSGKFSFKGTQYELDKLKCKIWPQSEQHNSGVCGGSFKLVETAFNVANNLVPIMSTCFDDQNDRTLYTKMTLTKNAGLQKGVPRPQFNPGTFFTGVLPGSMYNNQKNKFRYLGAKKAIAYFGGSNFFNKGHLAAKSDFEFGAGQISTFWLTNAPPQWESFNSGNWEKVESTVRNYANTHQKDLEVYTGTRGTLDLLFDSGSKKKIYLHAGPPSKVPVPEYFWKVVIDKTLQQAVAFIGFNNPYLTTPDLAASLKSMCPDICHQLTWLPAELDQVNRRKIHEGYIFCCDVTAFRGIVTEFPDKTDYHLL